MCDPKYKEDLIALGQIIDSAIKNKKNCNGETLARELDIDPARISKLRNGKQLLYEPHLIRACKFLGISKLDIPERFRWRDENEEAKLDAVLQNTSKLIKAIQPKLSSKHGQVLLATEIDETTPQQRRKQVGSYPTWSRLVSGSYMLRPELLANVKATFFEWQNCMAENLQMLSVPVFWIEGRSGDGKSVVLLQLAQHLTVSQPQTLIIIAHGPNEMIVVLEYAQEVVSADTDVLLVIDDMHRVSDLEFLEKHIDTFLQESSFRFAIIACGPIPERKAFQKQSALFDISTFECPPVNTEDRSAFLAWFQVEPDTKYFQSDLLVELLFEMKVGGSIMQFARSFGRRLQERGLFELARCALAANVFDALAPYTMLPSAALRAGLAELSRENQLHFEIMTQHGVKGFRLVHRVIALRLFEEWSKGQLTDADTIPFLGECLSQVIQTVPGSEYTYFVSLLGSIHAQVDLLITENRESDGSVYKNLAKEMLLQLQEFPSARCYVARFALLSVTDAGLLDEEIINAAISARDDANALAVARVNVGAAIVRVTKGDGKWESQIDSLKSMIADPGLRQYASPAIMTLISLSKTREFGINCGLQWLADVGDAPAAQQLLATLLSRTGGRRDVIDRALAWLKIVENDTRVASVLSILLGKAKTQSDVINRAMLWVRENNTSPRTQPVIAALLALPQDLEEFPNIVSLAKNWIDAVGPEIRAQTVLVPLLRATNGEEDIVRRALSWLDAVGAKPEVQQTWATLLSTLNYLPCLVTLALKWIREIQPQSGGQQVLATLLSQPESNEEIVAFAIQWLEGEHRSQSGGQQVLATLLSQSRGDANIIAFAMQLIESIGHTAVSADVVRVLISSTRGSDEAANYALSWLGVHGTEQGTEHVLSALLSGIENIAEPEKGRLQSAAIKISMKWLATVKDHFREGRVWPSLLKVRGNKTEVIQKAWKWLDTVGSIRQADDTAIQLIKAAWNVSEVESFMLNWIAGIDENSRAAVLLSVMLKETKGKDQIVEKAIELVNRIEPSVWKKSPRTSQILWSLARYASQNESVVSIVNVVLEGDYEISTKIKVLTALLHGSGSTGPGIDILLSGKAALETGSRPHLDWVVLCVSAANAVHQIIGACSKRPECRKDLCYLIACANPEKVQLALADKLLSIREDWPIGCEQYLWRAVLKDLKSSPDTYRDELIRWIGLIDPSDHSEVVWQISQRPDVDSEFVVFLPEGWAKAVDLVLSKTY